MKRIRAETTTELDALLPSILDKAFKGELLTSPAGAVETTAETAARRSQVVRGETIAKLTLLLHTFGVSVTRDAVEHCLLLLLNEDVRKRLLGNPVAVKGPLNVPVDLDSLIPNLKANMTITVEASPSGQMLGAGPNAKPLSIFSEKLQAEAHEALTVYRKLKTANRLSILGAIWHDKSAVLEESAA